MGFLFVVVRFHSCGLFCLVQGVVLSGSVTVASLLEQHFWLLHRKYRVRCKCGVGVGVCEGEVVLSDSD